MTKRIGRNINHTDEADVKDEIEANATTSVKIADANHERIFFHVNNNSSTKEVWIKLQPANLDDDKKGILLEKKQFPDGHWEMPSDNIYTGEICVISESGNAMIYVTEY